VITAVDAEAVVDAAEANVGRRKEKKQYFLCEITNN
jgi:hypothetical protein